MYRKPNANIEPTPWIFRLRKRWEEVLVRKKLQENFDSKTVLSLSEILDLLK